MKQDRVVAGKRRAVNISVSAEIIDGARAEGLNLSQISEAALLTATRVARDVRWKAENREWIDAHHRWVDENELPLEKYRLF